MRARLVILFVTALLAIGMAAPAASARVAETTGISSEVTAALQTSSSVAVIVSLRGEAAPARGSAGGAAAARGAIAAAGTRVLAALSPSDFHLRRRYAATPALAGTVTDAGARALALQPDVLNVALDFHVQADLTQAVPLVRADDAQAQFGVTGAGVVVAVMDSGIDTDHPMLVDSLTHQECFNTTASCPSSPNVAEDGAGHGTHVSGIVTSNGPPAGVAPDASIEAFRVLDDTGDGTLSDVLSAYDHIIGSHPEVDLINMSFGDEGSHPPGTCDGIPAVAAVIAASRAMGITSFAAAGNSQSKNGLSWPACVTGVVSVGAVYDANVGAFLCDATTAADKVACFSQSDLSLDLLAPGALIESTYVGGGLGTLAGTSMASPLAVGVAALLLDSEPSLTPAQLETRLKETGTPIQDTHNGVTTCRVDAYEAVANDGGSICQSHGPVSFVGGLSERPNQTLIGSSGTPGTSRADARRYAMLILLSLSGVAVAIAWHQWCVSRRT